MSHYQYLAVLGVCLVVTLPLEFVLHAHVYRQPKRLILTLIPTALIFSTFDVGSIAWHWWRYSAKFTTGILLPGNLPLEEVLFFIVIPICGLLTFEAVKSVKNSPKPRLKLILRSWKTTSQSDQEGAN